MSCLFGSQFLAEVVQKWTVRNGVELEIERWWGWEDGGGNMQASCDYFVSIR